MIKHCVKLVRQPAAVTLMLLALTGAPVCVQAETWNSLTSEQQEALAPLAEQWNNLPIPQQHHLLHTVKHYSSLTPVQKQRFQNRLTAWSRLTPKQREAARKKYRALSKAPPEKREQMKQMIRDKQNRKGREEKEAEADDDFLSEPLIPSVTGTP